MKHDKSITNSFCKPFSFQFWTQYQRTQENWSEWHVNDFKSGFHVINLKIDMTESD